MKISKINNIGYFNNNFNLSITDNRKTTPQYYGNNTTLSNIYYTSNVNFKSIYKAEKTVPDIDFTEYKEMSDVTKERYRKVYKSFQINKSINKDDLFDPKFISLPLQSEAKLEKFFEISKEYLKYKDQSIICLGRSPKWFLNAALWMKDGIEHYKFVAFSKYWYTPDKEEGARKIQRMAPTEEEEAAYKKYLKSIKADPKGIINEAKKTGKKVIITDYVCTGKGMCSFLDLVGRYAEEQGVLEEFANSIEIVGIGSLDYMEELNPYAEYIPTPSVPLPQILWPYYNKIPQHFHDMDYNVFRDMLLNQNTNECRSTYYPHDAWTLYKPHQFKTGLIKDLKKVDDLIKRSKTERCTTSFKPAMADYRNLLNFRILDGLNKRGLLKLKHVPKI
ncbi:hypothetical protein IJD34_04235 [bacterium]|nr:hypothetical protein [bacterium]